MSERDSLRQADASTLNPAIAIATAINASDDVYEKDGLMYCSKCHTPKQLRLSVMGIEKVIWKMCDCRRREVEKEDAEREERMRKDNIESNRGHCFSVREMQNWTFENDDGSNPRLMKIAKRFVEKFEEMRAKKRGLLLYGSVGIGKTYASACIANALIDEGYSCYFTSFTAIERRLFDADNRQEVIDELNSYSLLVIDDLATERNTAYMREIVTDVLENRCRSGKPIIVTTNLSFDQLTNESEMDIDRIYSRIIDLTFPIEVKGEDRRKQKLIDSANELMSMLDI